MSRIHRMDGAKVGLWGIAHKLMGLLIVVGLLSTMAPNRTIAEATPVTVDDLPTYTIDVDLTTTNRTIAGTMTLAWTNHTDEAQDTLWFRVYPNAAYYGDAETVIEQVTVDGEEVTAMFADDPTVLEVPTQATIAPGGRATIEIAFSTIVPENVAAGFGIFQHDTASGVWNLADWYPILAGWEPGVGWYLQEPTQFGDPTFAETATYDVAISLPDDLTLVSTGATTNRQLGMLGFRDEFITTGPAREFAMTLLPGDVDVHEASAGDVTVRTTLPETQAVPGLGEFMAETAADAVETYAGWLGAYPSSELDLSVAQLSGASGVSWSGITWFGLDSITRDGKLSDEEKTGLAFVILHEVGHQWFADAVGSNNNDHGFMTEGLVQALAVLAADSIYGPERAQLYLQAWVAGPYSSLLNDKRDGIADAPLTNETNGTIRSLLVYGKAGVGFIAIRNEIGEDAFLAGLARYTTDFRFAISAPEDLQSAFDDACGCETGATWSFWFAEDGAKRADLDVVLADYAAE